MDKYDLRGEGPSGEGTLHVLEYQQQQGQKKKVFNNVYVKNFSQDPEFTDEQLATLFSQYGAVHNACVMRDQNGHSKGFGFVCFKEAGSAEQAIQAWKGKVDEHD